jgi:NAD(P)-dependent dehydrogenase (short-subunit alcohol dehydrogenase family)
MTHPHRAPGAVTPARPALEPRRNVRRRHHRASRGIGAATARLAAERGHDVCVNFRANASAADAVVADVRAAGRRALAVQADVATEADVVRLFETVDATLGIMAGLVNNAGILERQTRAAVSRDGLRDSALYNPWDGVARLPRSLAPFSGCSRRRLPTRQARSSMSPAADERSTRHSERQAPRSRKNPSSPVSASWCDRSRSNQENPEGGHGA